MTNTTGLTGASWLKSSYSDNGGECVEVAPGFRHTVPVRDSKDPHSPALHFTPEAWSSFIAAVSDDELPTA